MSYQKFRDDVTKYYNKRSENTNSKDPDYIVRDEWIEKKRFKELISFILENWDSGNCDEFMQPLIKILINNQETGLYKQLWKGVIRNRLEKLWDYNDFLREHFPALTVSDLTKIDLTGFNQFSSNEDIRRVVAYHRQYTLNGIAEFIEGLETLHQPEEIERQKSLYQVVSSLQKPAPRPSTDKRKIDETLFWQLIEQSRANTSDKFQFLDHLKSTLESFYPKEIRAFDKFLRIKINELNTWEIWALAYIVRRGCGDDAFDYFKAWVVSKGQKAFMSILASNEKNLPSLFDEDPQLEELYYLAGEVYEEKTSDIMKEPRVKSSKLTGRQWKEDNLRNSFPGLCELFNYPDQGNLHG